MPSLAEVSSLEAASFTDNTFKFHRRQHHQPPAIAQRTTMMAAVIVAMTASVTVAAVTTRDWQALAARRMAGWAAAAAASAVARVLLQHQVRRPTGDAVLAATEKRSGRAAVGRPAVGGSRGPSQEPSLLATVVEGALAEVTRIGDAAQVGPCCGDLTNES